VTADPLLLAAEVARSDERLLATTRDLDVSAPSLLPGWTRGHVITHIARNADGYVNLLTWALTGVKTAMYASLSQRNSDISDGAGRPLDALLEDLEASAARFQAAVDAMTPAAWGAEVFHMSGRRMTPQQVVWARWREVEVHHVDLNGSYRPADWPEAFTLHLLREIAADFAGWESGLTASSEDLAFKADIGAAPAPITVRGPARAIAAWLIGRSTGDALRREPVGQLPAVPTWK
jgi:maleylpyruvate isomerase